jgi:hypothetical protein
LAARPSWAWTRQPSVSTSSTGTLSWRGLFPVWETITCSPVIELGPSSTARRSAGSVPVVGVQFRRRWARRASSGTLRFPWGLIEVGVPSTAAPAGIVSSKGTTSSPWACTPGAVASRTTRTLIPNQSRKRIGKGWHRATIKAFPES